MLWKDIVIDVSLYTATHFAAVNIPTLPLVRRCACEKHLQMNTERVITSLHVLIKDREFCHENWTDIYYENAFQQAAYNSLFGNRVGFSSHCCAQTLNTLYLLLSHFPEVIL